MKEAKLEHSHSLFAPRSMQMILLQLTSISGSVSCSMMESGCQAGARRRPRVMYSFNSTKGDTLYKVNLPVPPYPVSYTCTHVCNEAVST